VGRSILRDETALISLCLPAISGKSKFQFIAIKKETQTMFTLEDNLPTGMLWRRAERKPSRAKSVQGKFYE